MRAGLPAGECRFAHLHPCHQALGLRLYGTETGTHEHYHRFADERMLPPPGDYREKVAVVGSGVAGLTVAHDLARAGYKVTVFEASSVPGGMLTHGVPTYRLPRELVMAEIEAILSLGVELRLDTRVGTPGHTLADLQAQGFSAFYLGAGLQGSRRLDVPGGDLPGVIHGLEFLKLANLGQAVDIGPRVVVVGGGNVAFDVARMAARASGAVSVEGKWRTSASPPTWRAPPPGAPACGRSTWPASNPSRRCRPTPSRSKRGSTRG